MSQASGSGGWRRLPVIIALGLAFSAQGRTSSAPDVSHSPAETAAPVSLVADGSACKPGRLEEILNRWLASAEDSDFESEFVAMAFDELVDLVHLLRDVAQDFCM
jgi:hypothetical protein